MNQIEALDMLADVYRSLCSLREERDELVERLKMLDLRELELTAEWRDLSEIVYPIDQ